MLLIWILLKSKKTNFGGSDTTSAVAEGTVKPVKANFLPDFWVTLALG